MCATRRWNDVWPALAGAKTWLWRAEQLAALLQDTLPIRGYVDQLDHTRQNYLTQHQRVAECHEKHISEQRFGVRYISYTHADVLNPPNMHTGYTCKLSHKWRQHYCHAHNDYVRCARATTESVSILWQFPKFRMRVLPRCWAAACANNVINSNTTCCPVLPSN